MALLDREREQVRFTEFKAAFKQTFTTTPPSGTFYGQNPSRNYDCRDYNKERRGRTHSRDRATSRPKDSRSRDKSPYRPRRSNSHSPGIRDSNNRSASIFTSFHTNGPGKTYFLPGHSVAAWGRALSLNWGVI